MILRLRQPALALACLFCAWLGLVAAPAAAGTNIEAATVVSSAQPQLLLIHGGSFLFDDPSFEPLTREAALAAGFGVHYLRYPLGNLPAAVRAARSEARRLRSRYGWNVFAYGTSAGALLAALLAGDGLVSAAAAKAPPSDLLTWTWPIRRYGPGYFAAIGAGPATRRRLSPLRRRARRPVLVIQGREDPVIPPSMNAAYASKFRRVHLWSVPGGHATERLRPWVLERAMRWLANTARAQASAMRRAANR